MEPTQLQELGRAVAEHLDGWAYEAPSDHAQRDYGSHAWCIAPDGARFALYTGYGNGCKVIVMGTYPQHHDGGHVAVYENGREVKDPRIGCSPARGPEAIARDIQRRFLPAYREHLAKAKAEVHRQTEYHKRTVSAAGRLAAAVGVADKGDGQEFSFYGGDTHVYGRVRASGDGTAKLDLSNIPLDVAERILQIVRERM